MNRNRTPVIVREDEQGNVIGLIPTMVGSFVNYEICSRLNTQGEFSTGETYKSFMARTSGASTSQERKFLERVNKNYEGTYYGVKRASQKMHTQRRGNLLENPEMLSQS